MSCRFNDHLRYWVPDCGGIGLRYGEPSEIAVVLCNASPDHSQPLDIRLVLSTTIQCSPDYVSTPGVRGLEALFKVSPTKEQILEIASFWGKDRTLVCYGDWDLEYLEPAVDARHPPINMRDIVANYCGAFNKKYGVRQWPTLEAAAKAAGIEYPKPGPHHCESDAWVCARLYQEYVRLPNNLFQQSLEVAHEF